jgi:hypothetical protein
MIHTLHAFTIWWWELQGTGIDKDEMKHLLIGSAKRITTHIFMLTAWNRVSAHVSYRLGSIVFI